MTSAGQDVNKHQTEYIPFSLFPSNSYSSFWRLRCKPWSILPQYNGYIVRQSTTKLRLRRLKTEDTCTFCFRNTPTGKAGQTFAPFAQPLRRNQPCHRLCSTITKLIHVHARTYTITYRNTPTGKARKTLATFTGHPETPDFISSSTWLDNNEIIHVSVYFQAHPAQALQLATTYQCCIQAQS